MSGTLFDNLRPGRPNCPSDLQLDKMHAGELSAQKAAQISAHLATCAACTKHLQSNQIAELAPARAEAMLSGLRARLSKPPKTSLWQRLSERLNFDLRGLGTPILALGAASVLAVVVGKGYAPWKSAGDDSADVAQVREKGGLALHVHRLTAQGSVEVPSGAALGAGDRLRFVVDLPQPGHIAIVGVEQNGTLYSAWPLSENTETPLLPAGPRQILPGAISLDDSLGKETLYLVFCPSEIGSPINKCQSRGAEISPNCPSGCTLAAFSLQKSRAR